jgi:hypothetical protein
VSEALRQDLAKRTCALYSADPDLDRPTPAPPQVTQPPPHLIPKRGGAWS